MKASVSVIIPHYNAVDTIRRSIDSVVNQTVAVGEVIIVDDGSSSVEELKLLVASYENIISIVLVLLKTNRGAPHARNVGIQHSKFKYIAFLDSDDIWHPEKIEIQSSAMEKHGLFLSGHGYIFDLNKQGFQTQETVLFTAFSKSKFRWGNPLFTPTVMVRREGFILFDERFRRVDDYKCWYENLCNGNYALLSSELAGGFKAPIGASGLSASLELMHVAYLEVLKSLFREKKMTWFEYIMTAACEQLKYPIRLLIFRFRGK